MTTMMKPPTLQRPLSDKHRRKLLRMARTYSESFARRVIQASTALDNGDDGKDVGVEYVDSLNGINVYEDVVVKDENEEQDPTKASGEDAATRLRSFCHIEAEIKDVARRLSTSAASSHLLPGIVDSQELESVLDERVSSSLEDLAFPEHAGINWFVLNQESMRDSLAVRSSQSQRESDGKNSDGTSFEFIVLSYQGLFKHREKRGWIQWCQSIELPGLPAHNSAEKKRGVVFSSGIIAVESATRPGQVSVCYSMGVDLRQCEGPSQRKFLDGAVWKRVMKLAALKKSLLRDSLTRTLSIGSADMAERDDEEDSRREEEPSKKKTTVKQQPQDEPWLRKMVPEKQKEKVTVTRSSETPRRTLHRVTNRLRAQTMEPPSQQRRHHESLYKEPNTLEFRLSLYKDPEDEPICGEYDVPPKTRASGWFMPQEPKTTLSSSFCAPAPKPRKTKVRSLTGWL